MSAQQWNSYGYTASLGGPPPQFEAAILGIEAAPAGIKLTGTFTLRTNTLALPEYETGALRSATSVGVSLALSDNGSGTDATYLARVISASMNVIGQIRTRAPDGSLSNPRLLSKTSSGRGIVHEGLVRLRFEDLLPPDTAAVNPGFSATFDLVLGPFAANGRVPVPRNLRATVVDHTIGRQIPPFSDFVTFDSSVDVQSSYSDSNLRLTASQLQDLQTGLGDETLALNCLYIESIAQGDTQATTPDETSACREIKIGPKLIVAGSVIVDLGQVNYDNSMNAALANFTGDTVVPVPGPNGTLGQVAADGKLFTSATTASDAKETDAVKGTNSENGAMTEILPSLTINGGTIAGDIVFVGKRALPRLSAHLRLTSGACLMGTPRTMHGPVIFSEFLCQGGSYVSEASEIHVYGAISVGGDFKPVRYPFQPSIVVISESMVNARIVTGATVFSVGASTIGDVDLVAYGTREINIAVVETKGASLSLRIIDAALVPTNSGNYLIEGCTLERLRVAAEKGEAVLVSSSSIATLDIGDSSGLELYFMATGENTRNKVGHLELDAVNHITFTGRADITRVTDTRLPNKTDPATRMFRAQGAQVNIGRMRLNLNGGFPAGRTDLVSSTITIGTIDLFSRVLNGTMEETQASFLHLSCGNVHVREIIDHGGLTKGVYALRAVVGEMIHRGEANFSLVAFGSSIRLNFTKRSAGLVSLISSVGSSIDVSGRAVTAAAPSQLIEADGLLGPDGSTAVVSEDIPGEYVIVSEAGRTAVLFDNTTSFRVQGGSRLSYLPTSVGTVLGGQASLQRFADLVIAYPHPGPNAESTVIDLPAGISGLTDLVRQASCINGTTTQVGVVARVDGSAEADGVLYTVRPDILASLNTVTSFGGVPRVVYGDVILSSTPAAPGGPGTPSP